MEWALHACKAFGRLDGIPQRRLHGLGLLCDIYPAFCGGYSVRALWGMDSSWEYALPHEATRAERGCLRKSARTYAMVRLLGMDGSELEIWMYLLGGRLLDTVLPLCWPLFCDDGGGSSSTTRLLRVRAQMSHLSSARNTSIKSFLSIIHISDWDLSVVACGEFTRSLF